MLIKPQSCVLGPCAQVPGHQQPDGRVGHQQRRVRGDDAVRAGEDVREGVRALKIPLPAAPLSTTAHLLLCLGPFLSW